MNNIVEDLLKQGISKLINTRKSPLVVLGILLLVLILYTQIYSCISNIPSACWVNISYVSRLNFFSFTEIYWLNNVVKTLFTLLILYFFFLIIVNIKRKKELTNEYELNEGNFEKDWEIQGICLVEIEGKNKILKIINSEVGCILKNRRWNNYEFTFEFKIPKLDDLPDIHWQHRHDKKKCADKYDDDEVLHRGFGVIIKAKSLDEYHMLKIDINGYHPHTRAIYWENLGPVVTMNKPSKDWIDKWITAKFLVNGNFVNVTINSQHQFSYFLPSFSAITNSREKLVPAKFLRLNNRNGSIGFRCSPAEVVYIRNLIVKNKENFITSILHDISNYFSTVLNALKGEVDI